MKLSLDTIQKTITIEESVNLNEFYEMIKKLLPDDLWKDFKLETNVIQNWNSPIIIKEYPIYPIYPSPSLPYQPPYWITCQTGTNIEGGFADTKTTYSLNSGVFNIDCQIKN